MTNNLVRRVLTIASATAFAVSGALMARPMDTGGESRKAAITGARGGPGVCSIAVHVDGAAEVEIFGDTGSLRTLSGRPATWRNFQCTGPLPRVPSDFGFGGISGRGTVRIVRDPRGNGGRAVIQINDPKAGSADYAMDLRWRDASDGGWMPGPPSFPPHPGDNPAAFPLQRAVRVCQTAVVDQLNADGYPNVTFDRTSPDGSSGRLIWVAGRVTGRSRFDARRLSFSCSVDRLSGRIRTLDFNRRGW